MVKIQGLFHRLGLMVQFSRMNLKHTFVTLVGLTIGLSMLSAALFQLDSTRNDFYFHTLAENHESLTFGLDIRGRVENNTLNKIDEIKEYFNVRIREDNLEHIYQPNLYHSFSQILGIHYNQTVYEESYELYGIGRLNNSLLTECIPDSRLPTNLREILVYVNDTTASPIALDEQLNITIFYSKSQAYERYDVPLTVVGVMTPATITGQSVFHDIVEAEKLCFITSMNASYNLVQTLAMEIQDKDAIEVDFTTVVRISYPFNFSEVTRLNVLDVVNKILDFNAKRGQWDREYGDYSVITDLPTSSLERTITDFEALFSSFVILSLPCFIVIASLVMFSLGLINEKRQHSLQLLKIRSVSNQFIFLILSIEAGIIAFISASLAILFGLPLAFILGSSTSLMEFAAAIDPSSLVLKPVTIFTIFIMSGIVTVFLQLPSNLKLARSSILLLSKEGEKKRRGKIKTIFAKFDVSFLVLGSVGVVVFSYLADLLTDNPVEREVFTLLFPFLRMLIFFSPLFLLIGFISVFTRFLPRVIHSLGNLFWRKDWRLLAITLRNLGESTDVTNRVTLLVALTLSLTIIFAILPISYYNQTVENVYYMAGGEITYTSDRWDGGKFKGIVHDLKNVSGFAFTTIKEWFGRDPVDPYKEYHFMRIEENFAEFAYWQSYYAEKPLASLVTDLFASTANNSVIGNSRALQQENLSVGSNFSIDLGNLEVQVSILAVTNYFPRMTHLSGFISHWIINKALTPMADDYYTNTLIGKVLPGADKDQVISLVKQVVRKWDKAESTVTTRGLVIVEEVEAIRVDGLLTRFQWLVINANVLAGFVVILSAITLFTITRVFRHTGEVALSRSLGMKFPQLFSLMFLEPLLLFILSGIPGGIVGGFLVLGIAGMEALVPFYSVPLVLYVNFVLILGIYLGLSLIILCVGFVASLMAIRTDISKILKVE